MDEYIGIIKMFAGNFAPKGWALCNGQLLSINQYTALFSILGTSYGGNGQTTFALPNLQGNVPIGVGTSQGTNYTLGQIAGTTSVSILTSNLPAHTHSSTLSVNNGDANAHQPTAGGSIAAPKDINGDNVQGFTTAAPNTQLAAGTTGPVGSNLPISIMQPYLAVTYIICLQGIYPSRN